MSAWSRGEDDEMRPAFGRSTVGLSDCRAVIEVGPRWRGVHGPGARTLADPEKLRHLPRRVPGKLGCAVGPDVDSRRVLDRSMNAPSRLPWP